MVVRWPRILNPTQLSQILRNQKNPLTALEIFNEARSKYPDYRHNGAVYGTMIDLLGRSGRITEMKHVIQVMKQDSCECKDSVFVSVFKTYAKAGMIDEAVGLYRSLPEFNCVNWTASYNTLLGIMLRESKLECFYDLLVDQSNGWAIKSRLGSLNMLMDVLCRIECWDLAMQVFGEMHNHCCFPDRRSYRVLMEGLCKNGRLHEATHLLYAMLWRISQKGCGEDIVVYRTLLNALCEDGHISEAVEVLGKVLRKGLKASKSRCKLRDFDQLRDTEDVEHAKILINEALIRGAIPSSASYSAVATDLYSEGEISKGDRVLDVMRGRGFRPSLKLYEAKAAAMCRAGKVDEAGKVIEEEMVNDGVVPNSQVYNIVINGLCSHGKPDLAIRFLDKMDRQKGTAPDKDTFSFIIDAVCRDGRFSEASKILERMLSKSFWPGDASFSTLITGLCSSGRLYEAVIWLEESISHGNVPNSSVWSNLASSVFCNKLKNHHSLEVLDQLRSY